MSIRKRLILIAILSLSTVLLSGCGSSLAQYVRSDYPTQVTERAEANKDVAADLNKSGYISDELYTKLCEQIDSATQRALAKVDQEAVNVDGTVNIDAISGMAKSISWVQLHRPQFVEILDNNNKSGLEYFSGSFLSKKVDDGKSLSSFVLSNYLYGSYFGKKKDESDAIYSQWIEMDKPDPVDFFGKCSEELEAALNEKFKLPVYVLDAEKITKTDSSMDEVLASIQQAINNGDINGLTQYFSELKDKDGKTVTLMDDDFKITGISKTNTDNSHNEPGYDLMMKQTLYYSECGGKGNCACWVYDDKAKKWKCTCGNCEANGCSSGGFNGGNAGCGSWRDGKGGCEDTNCARPHEITVATIQFNEFDSDQVRKLKDTIHNNEKSYYFQVGSNGTAAAYLLEYPVSVIDEFKRDTDDNTKIVGTLNNNSGIGINIGTGKLISYDSDGNGGYKLSGTTVETDDTYLTTAFNASESDNGKSSFVAKGISEVEIPVAGASNVKAYVPQIVLRDYLEATWAPGSTDYTENLVVFGRKIRFRTEDAFWKVSNTLKVNDAEYNQYEFIYNTDNADNCAFFVDIDGNEVGTLTKLYITDICDITSLTEGDSSQNDANNKWAKYVVKHFSEAAEQQSTKKCKAKDDDVTPDIKKLAHSTEVDSIKASTMFPGEYIDTLDYKDSNSGTKIQRFYCVATTKGMFDSALFSDWINSTASNASLDWWNGYLSSHDYKYVVGHEKVNEYLQTNYKYELSQSDAIILDLNTVAKIQQIYDKEDNENRNSLIRTLFIVFGVFLIAYSMVLALCWIIDTQADVGLSLLNKITFGHWTAVQHDEEIPQYNKDSEHTYIGSKQILKKCIFIIAIAILVIQVDVSRVVLRLIQSFGKIGVYAEKMIKGITG